MANVIEIQGVGELMNSINAMQTKRIEKDVRAITREVLRKAASQLRKDAKAELDNDPRAAYKAVRSSVYKRIMGGQVNILAPRRASGMMSTYHPPRTLRPGQRGGNRMTRSQRTNQVDSYYGKDRGFILRFINAGTRTRYTGSRTGMKSAKRGHLTATNWFPQASTQAMNQAAEQFAQLVERLIEEKYNNG